MHISIRQLIMIAMGILPRSVEYRAQNKHCLDTHNQVLGKWYVSSSEAVSNLSSFCLFENALEVVKFSTIPPQKAILVLEGEL